MNPDRIPYTPSTDTRIGPTKPRFVPKGHDRVLDDLQKSGAVCLVRRMGGEVDPGVVMKRDKFTVTIRHTEGDFAGGEEVIFKHDIAGIIVGVSR